MKTQTYTKINTLYKRFKNLNKVELPNPAWKAFQNKIMIGNYSDEHMEYIKDLKFDCFSKIDGTNTKIVFLPSTGQCFFGGKTDNADLKQHFKIMPEIVERITPKLREMFPPESAKFVPVLNDKQQIQYRWPEGSEKITEVTAEDIRDYGIMWAVDLEEVQFTSMVSYTGLVFRKEATMEILCASRCSTSASKVGSFLLEC